MFKKNDLVKCALCVHHVYSFSGTRRVQEVKDGMCLIDDAWYGFNTIKKV